MQTTLRIDDQLYREAKAQAAREGTTMTRFLEEGLRLRLKGKSAHRPASNPFPVYHPPVPSALTDDDIRRMDREEQEAHDRRKLGLDPSPR